MLEEDEKLINLDTDFEVSVKTKMLDMHWIQYGLNWTQAVKSDAKFYPGYSTVMRVFAKCEHPEFFSTDFAKIIVKHVRGTFLTSVFIWIVIPNLWYLTNLFIYFNYIMYPEDSERELSPEL